MKAANLALRFLLELAALAALGYWGATAPRPTAARVALALGAPLAAALLWGIFVAPRARVALPAVVRTALALAVFGSAAAALAARGHDRLALALGATALVNAALLAIWREGETVHDGRT